MATWTFKINGGPKRVNHAAVCVDGIVYSFGGYCTGDDAIGLRYIEVHGFDTRLYKWSRLTYSGKQEDIPFQRYGHSAIAYEGSAFLFGGRTDKHGTSDHVYQFDVGTKTWSRPTTTGTVPFSRDGHSCCVVGNEMFVFAGYEQETMEFTNTVYALNLDTFVWRLCFTSGEEPIFRDFHTATSWRHYMIIFGGRSDEAGRYHTNHEIYSNDIYLFDTLRNHWIKPQVTGNKPIGRRSHNAFEFKDKIYIFGGYNGTIGLHFNDMHVYDPEKKHWSAFKPCGRVPMVRRRAVCCQLKDRIVIFGGTSPEIQGGIEKLNELEDLQLLDMTTSLRTLCMMAVLKSKIRYEHLPRDIITDLFMLTSDSFPGRVPHG